MHLFSTSRNTRSALMAAAVLVSLAGCSARPAADADVIVIGGGIAGLSAALEASAAGRRVIVVDAASVPGGHAMKAGGFALVGTPLQKSKGIEDDAEIAVRDLLAWGEDADPGWVRRYVMASLPEVHDWLAGFGVRWTFILDTPEHSVPRFHFAGGGASNVVVPMMAAAYARGNIDFRLNTEALELLRDGEAVTGVRVRNLRSGTKDDLHASAVIVATGGWQSNLDMVRRHWRKDIPAPERLYVGSGQLANGSGIELGVAAGASTTRMDHQATFTAGLPDPLDPSGTRALLAQNPAAIWVDARAGRFIDERAPSKQADEAILRLDPATHWIVFDNDGLRTLRIRDAVWLGNPKRAEPLSQAGLLHRADSIAALAESAGLPADALVKTVDRWNAFVEAGEDADFGRFSSAKPDATAATLKTPPFHALKLYPLTRKSMGGLAIDAGARVLNESGNSIPGLYAAGEVTGVAGINGRFGGEGTFLGPSVLLGRIAGRTAAGVGPAPVASPAPPALPASNRPDASAEYRAKSVTMTPDALESLIREPRPGYWHFEAAHSIVRERGMNCLNCHSPEWPTVTAVTAVQRELQLYSCDSCH